MMTSLEEPNHIMVSLVVAMMWFAYVQFRQSLKPDPFGTWMAIVLFPVDLFLYHPWQLLKQVRLPRIGVPWQGMFRGFGSVLRFLAWVLWLPFRGVAALVRIPMRLARRLPMVWRDTLVCPHCQNEISLLEQRRCRSCRRTLTRHVLVPCVCGQAPEPFFSCPVCRNSIDR